MRPCDAKPEHRAAALDAATQIVKTLHGTVLNLTEAPEPVPMVPTGCPALDVILGIGGLPIGRVVEVFGPPGSGKSTLMLQIMAAMQATTGTVALVDLDHRFDLERAVAMGVNLDRLLVAQPDSAEQALAIVETLIRSGAIDLVVVDSVPGLVPHAELDGHATDTHAGVSARLMSQALRKITGLMEKTGTIAVFVNAVEQRISAAFGTYEATTGGNALKFFSSVRIEVRRLDDGRARFKVVKNKLAPPFRTVDVTLGPTGFVGGFVGGAA